MIGGKSKRVCDAAATTKFGHDRNRINIFAYFLAGRRAPFYLGDMSGNHVSISLRCPYTIFVLLITADVI